VVPEKFPQQSFNPIPLYGFTQSFGRNHSQAGPLKIIFGKLSYLGVVSVGPLWLLFNLAYSQRRNSINRREMLTLWVIPAIILALVFTNEWHHLLWTNITPVSPEPGAVLIYDHGIAFYLNIFYIYSLMLAGTLILLRTSLRTFQQYVPQTLALVLGGLAPLIGNFLYLIVIDAGSGIDLTPFTIALMGLFYAGSTFYLKLFDLVPLARERLITDMVDGIIVIDEKERIIDLNATAIAIIGPGLVIGRQLETALAGWPDLLECCRIRDGAREVCIGERWLEVRVSPIFDYGEATGRVFALRDITKRKRAEEALKESEHKFRVYTETSTVAIFVHRGQQFTYVNRHAEVITGYTRNELMKMTFSDIVHPEYHEIVRSLASGLPGEPDVPTGYEIKFLARTAEVRWGYMSASRIEDNGKPAIIITAIDITDRKVTEQLLKDSEDKFRSIIEQTTGGILLVDRQGTIILYNHGAEVVLGLEGADVIGHPIWEVQSRVAPAHMRSPETIEKIKRGFFHYFDHSFARGPVTRLVELERPDGTRRITQNTIFPITNTKGLLMGMIIQDITEQAEAEKQLEAERQELKRSNEELEQFAFIASHDLQEPLRMVNSYVKLLERKYKGRLDEKADQYIAFAADGTQRMQYMIKDLLKYSRVSGKESAALPVDLGVVMTGALADLDAAIKESKAEIRFEALPRVTGDEGQIRQVLENLLGNAIKFRKNGQQPVIAVQAVRQGGFWEIAVSDNGIGIDPQYFKKLFVIFQRLHTREGYAGTGIGLAICKKIIERHGGSIGVESAPDRGTTFRFTLPAAD
jgi:PAS domain S-box-containing protein